MKRCDTWFVGNYRIDPGAPLIPEISAKEKEWERKETRGGNRRIARAHTYTHAHEDIVSRFNIYGLKYSRNHTGGGECTGMTCPGGRRRASIRMTRRDAVARPVRAKIIYIKRCRRREYLIGPLLYCARARVINYSVAVLFRRRRRAITRVPAVTDVHYQREYGDFEWW